jgi:hypothetical protein
MPRIQPPEGYITATEAKHILNISDSMVRVHAQKGRIGYLVPPGRKQGFYLKRDVEKLAHDLDVFLNIDAEVEASRFTRASVEDLPEIIEISKQLFGSGDREDRVTSLEDRIALLKKNHDVFYVLKREEEVIGFTYLLPFKLGTDKIEQLLRADLAGEVAITPEDIVEFKEGKHTQIYLVAIGMKPSIHISKRRVYAARLISNIMHFIVDLGRKGVVIETMTAVGFSKEGRRLLREFGFSEVPPLVPGKRIFTIKIEESGAPLILQYKQALAESGQNL